MIRRQRVLAVIPARGGSKGLPRKNVLPLAGKPMLAWSVEAASGSRYVDTCVVSSDDAEILNVASALGSDVIERPRELASDDAGSVDVVLHALDQRPGHDWVVLLQPTSPLRIAEDIDGTIDTLLQRDGTSGVSLARTKSPQWMFSLTGDGYVKPLLRSESLTTRRQELADAYVLNGAVYVLRSERLRASRRFIDAETLGYVMPKLRSVDVDDYDDFLISEAILRLREAGA